MVLCGCRQNDAEPQKLETPKKSASRTERLAANPVAPKPLDRETTRRSAERELEALPEAFPKGFPLPKTVASAQSDRASRQ